jgi:hypothetical protein
MQTTYKQVQVAGWSMRVKAEITPDTQLFRYGTGTYVVCTEVGRRQFEASDYAPQPLARVAIPWDWVPQEAKDKAARISDWPRVRQPPSRREWNFLGQA